MIITQHAAFVSELEALLEKYSLCSPTADFSYPVDFHDKGRKHSLAAPNQIEGEEDYISWRHLR